MTLLNPLLTVPSIDWDATKRLAERMTQTELTARITGMQNELATVDRQDRELGNNNGGLMRDELFVLHVVLGDKRHTDCPACNGRGRVLKSR